MSYTHLAGDVRQFMDNEGIEKAVLIIKGTAKNMGIEVEN